MYLVVETKLDQTKLFSLSLSLFIASASFFEKDIRITRVNIIWNPWS